MPQELNLQEMNEIKGGFPVGAITDGYCTVLEIQIENSFIFESRVTTRSFLGINAFYESLQGPRQYDFMERDYT